MHIEIPRRSSPAEKILLLAENLPATREQLLQEAVRVERLLESLDEPDTAHGTELTDILEEVFLLQLEGIHGVLEFDECGDDEILQESLLMLVESAQSLDELEDLIEGALERTPLVA